MSWTKCNFRFLVFLLICHSIICSEWRETPLKRISFGSCNHQDKNQEIWKAIRATKPDIFLWLGDNIYADTKTRFMPKRFEPSTIEQMREMYTRQKNQKDYSALRSEVKAVIGTWDDHDYGMDDGGKEVPFKKESKELFWDFMDVPKDSKLREQEGVYTSHTFGPAGKRVKIIILDTRYNRDPLFSKNGEVLGKQQWEWLEKELKSSDAEVKIIASSIQFIPHHHATLLPGGDLSNSPFIVEAWSHFPEERQKLLDILNRNAIKGVIILSGDIHMGEILKVPAGCMTPYDLYEITSSGLTHAALDAFPAVFLELLKALSPNPYGLGLYVDHNFGTVDFVWDDKPKIVLTLRDRNGNTVFEKMLFIESLYRNETMDGIECIQERDLPWYIRFRFFLVFQSTTFLLLFISVICLHSLYTKLCRKAHHKKA